KRGLSSDQPAENFRPFTQNTREETQIVKTPPAVDNSGRHAEIAQSESPSSIPCPAPPALTPENLYRIAGDGLRMMLDASRDQNRPLKERDIIEAAWALLPMLDIHASVWHEGQSTLGDHGLAFCLLLVDAQRDHPSYPVRNPGGLMRELIRRAKAGRLDFDASVAALQKRRNGVR
ncbi:replication initiation protein RepC, partial [Pseudosulfitobacter pseudonitzschiae]